MHRNLGERERKSQRRVKATHKSFQVAVIMMILLTAGSLPATAGKYTLGCWYDPEGRRTGADSCYPGGDLAPCANTGAICKLGESGICRHTGGDYAQYYVVTGDDSRACPEWLPQVEAESFLRDPIARFPLASDAEDATGNNDAMSLKGVEFRDGALYSYGVYTKDTASTYPKKWNLDEFAISARFLVTDTGQDDPADPTSFGRPVFITGHRWLGYYLEKDGTVSMKYNNDKMVTSEVRYTLGEWHTATVTYRDGIAIFYLDGKYAGGKKVRFDFVNSNPTPSIGITDYSNGRTFKGWLSDLTVSNTVATRLERSGQQPALGGSGETFLRDAIARFPLISDADDATGNNDAMSLKGVEFRDGALYSSGIYAEDTASTYPKNWNLDEFAISVRFLVTDTGQDDPTDPTSFGRPVFITGHRWLGFYLEKDGTVSMKYNNDKMVTSDVRYTLGEWHTATATYQDGIANFYLDGKYAGGMKVRFDFVNSNPTPSIGITDYSNGRTFKGWLSDLTVSNSAATRVTRPGRLPDGGRVGRRLPPTPSGGGPRTGFDLTGRWAAEYQCPVGTPRWETVSITQQGQRIEARKITGDPCVPAGYTTFQGTLSGNSGRLNCAVGSAQRPASAWLPGTLHVLDATSFEACSMVFVRTGSL